MAKIIENEGRDRHNAGRENDERAENHANDERKEARQRATDGRARLAAAAATATRRRRCRSVSFGQTAGVRVFARDDGRIVDVVGHVEFDIPLENVRRSQRDFSTDRKRAFCTPRQSPKRSAI